MPVALIAGLPQNRVARVKRILDRCDLPAEWSIKFAAGASATYPSISCASLEDIVGQMPANESPHIFGVTELRGEREVIQNHLVPHFRLRWLSSEPFVRQSPTIVAQIEAAVLEEQEWRTRVLPHNEKHALILPNIFDTACKDGNLTIWDRATKWGDEGLIKAAERLLQRFESVHRKRGQICLDDRGLVWNHAGERHGSVPIPRNWKFSLMLPDSFHFDVAYPSPKAFSITDAIGGRHTASKGPLHHLNIDAHGYVR